MAVLGNAFSAVLTIARELITDRAVKQALSDDIALIESKAADGIDDLEEHVAGWFASHYALPAPVASAPSQPAAPAEPVAAPSSYFEPAQPDATASDAFTPAAPAAADAAY